MSGKPLILVTGGAGYIGSHTLLSLLEHGFSVISTDNYLNSGPDTFTRIAEICGIKVRNYETDLCDLQSARRIFQENPAIRAIIHFAALKSVPESVEQPELYRKNNNGSLRNMLLCMKEFGIPDMIFSSSCSVYGNVEEQPVDENTPWNRAESPYGETKQDGERMLAEFVRENPSKRVVALRYFNPVGAHPSGKLGEIQKRYLTNLVPILCSVASGNKEEVVIHGADYGTRDGTCVRDYIHVCDIAKAHVLAYEWLRAGAEREPFTVFNLGSGSGNTVKEVIGTFEKVNGLNLKKRTGPRRSGDVAVICSKAEKARRELGWMPEYSLEEMLRSAWRWEKHFRNQ